LKAGSRHLLNERSSHRQFQPADPTESQDHGGFEGGADESNNTKSSGMRATFAADIDRPAIGSPLEREINAEQIPPFHHRAPEFTDSTNDNRLIFMNLSIWHSSCAGVGG